MIADNGVELAQFCFVSAHVGQIQGACKGGILGS